MSKLYTKKLKPQYDSLTSIVEDIFLCLYLNLSLYYCFSDCLFFSAYKYLYSKCFDSMINPNKFEMF